MLEQDIKMMRKRTDPYKTYMMDNIADSHFNNNNNNNR